MFTLTDTKSFEKLLIDAELRSTREIAEFVGLSTSTIDNLRNGAESTLETILKVGNRLTERVAELDAA